MKEEELFDLILISVVLLLVLNEMISISNKYLRLKKLA